MSRLARLSAILFAATALGLTTADAAPTFTRTPGATGPYLAGQEALNDLRTGDAAKFFDNAVAADPHNPLLLDRAFYAEVVDGQIDTAEKTAHDLLEVDPENEMARLVIGADAVHDGRFADAVTELDQVGSDTFAGITGGILKAWALIGEGKPDDGLAIMDELGSSGLEEFLVFHRALMLEVAGRTDEAIDAAGRAYEADSHVAWVVEAYVRMLANADRYDEAQKVLDAYAADGFSHPLVDALRVDVTAKKHPGPFADTAQVGAAQMFHGVGMALGRDGGLDIAMLFLQLAHHLDPDAEFINISMGQLFDAAKQYDRANEIYKAIPASSVMYDTAAIRIAQNLDSAGDHDGSLAALRQIVERTPGDVDALSILGDTLRGLDRFDEAITAYTQAIDATGGENTSDWRFFYVRGIAYEQAEQWPKAEADFQKALKLNPDQPQVLNYLGYSWVDQGIHLQPALDMIQKAVSKAPNDGYIIDSLGWAYFRLGRFDEAVKVLEQAVQMLPDDPEINDHLGDAYWRVGRKLEATFQWNVASAVDDVGKVRARVLPKLAGGLDNAPVDPDSAPIADPAAAGSADATQ